MSAGAGRIDSGQSGARGQNGRTGVAGPDGDVEPGALS